VQKSFPIITKLFLTLTGKKVPKHINLDIKPSQVRITVVFPQNVLRTFLIKGAENV